MYAAGGDQHHGRESDALIVQEHHSYGDRWLSLQSHFKRNGWAPTGAQAVEAEGGGARAGVAVAVGPESVGVRIGV